MLDFDLAEMYGIENRVLKQAVRRNLKRFEGEDFMFELSKEELSRSQIVTLNVLLLIIAFKGSAFSL